MAQIYTQSFIPPMPGRPSSYDRRPVHDSYSSRDLQKSDAYSSHYQQYQRGTQEPRSPMSEHRTLSFEAPLPKAAELFTKRPEISQNPPREKLPPLSSLFGSASSHQGRPAPSTHSDRHSPVFSPSDARRPGSPHQERSYESSYLQRPGASRQYSYNSQSEPVERVGFPAAPHARARAESPQYESHHGPAETPRSQYPSGWSPRSQGSRQEYFVARDTSSSFRPLSEHRPHPPQIYRPEQDSRPTFHDPPYSAQVTSNYPPTPASTVEGDPATAKDGLGPKIWTGTQFLPRFVRQAEVLGEGMCYFYDDGTHCKTVIDGEIVNAHWGVTKAGKPRKRLAIACITCREKKIKCDPDYPRCVQCEKFGRICKFKNAPRGGQGSPDTPPADPEDLSPRPASSRTDAESFLVEKREQSHSVSPRQALRQSTPNSEAHQSKRQRTGYADFTLVASVASPRLSSHELTSPSNTWRDALVTSPIDHNVLRHLQMNPFITHPTAVTELIEVFFKYAPETAYCMFPERPFKAWLLSAGEKSLDDLMLIYTILTLGTVFSSKPEHKALGIQFASIARYASCSRHFTIQLVQSRLILSLYYFAINSQNDSWDACGGAVKAASALRLNVEFEKSEDAYLKTFPCGLTRDGYAECRRRTFWCCYLVDASNGACSGHFSIIHPEDIFLRLPCDANSFESQHEVHNPYFDISSMHLQTVHRTVGTLAHLINITTIWGTVLANVYRTARRPIPAASNSAFISFYDRMTESIQLWKDSLPSSDQFSVENLQRARERGKLRTFMTIHVVYHAAVMNLNRYMELATLSATQIDHHMSVAERHAEILLQLMDALSGRWSTPTLSVSHERDGLESRSSSPFMGYSILSAVDILTARVSLAAVPGRVRSLDGAQLVLGQIGLFWQSARTQQALIAQRIRDLTELAASNGEETGSKAGHVISRAGREVGSGVVQMREAMEKTFARDYDVFYAL